MHRFFATAFATALFLTVAAPSVRAATQPAATAAPKATADPAVTASAKSFYHALATANIDRSKLNAEANAKLTDQVIKDVSAKLAPLGDPVTFDFVKSQQQSGSMLYAYLLGFGSGDKVEFVVGFDAQGKVSALALRPVE